MRKYVFIFLTVFLVATAARLSFGNTTEQDRNVYYESIDINKGDTLWCIAEKYKNDNISTIEYVSQIKEFNNMKSDKIKIGQKILIPVFK